MMPPQASIPASFAELQRPDVGHRMPQPHRGDGAAAADGAAEKLAALDLAGYQHRKPLLSSFDLQGVTELIKAGKAQKIVVMAGAGISVSAGIPDFRTPGTGLYSQLQRFNLPWPEAVFDVWYFRHDPKPFCMLAKELWPGYHKHAPTPAHHFLRLLHEQGLLLTVFTQNIDGLEQIAGLPADKVVHAHGAFDRAHCIDCRRPASIYAVQAAVCDDSVPTCDSCGGLVKPDITFFGEALPARFHRRRLTDLPQADLLLVMGTSLLVQPFAGMIDQVPSSTPRVLINLTRAGECKQQGQEQQQQDQDKQQQQQGLRRCGMRCLLKRHDTSSSLDSSRSDGADSVVDSSDSSDGISSDEARAGSGISCCGSLSAAVTRTSSEAELGSCGSCCCCCAAAEGEAQVEAVADDGQAAAGQDKAVAAAVAASAAITGEPGTVDSTNSTATRGPSIGRAGSSNGLSSGGSGSGGGSNGSSGSSGVGFEFGARGRDVLHLGDCDIAVLQLASLLGWQGQLQQLVAAGDAAFEEARGCWEE